MVNWPIRPGMDLVGILVRAIGRRSADLWPLLKIMLPASRYRLTKRVIKVCRDITLGQEPDDQTMSALWMSTPWLCRLFNPRCITDEYELSVYRNCNDRNLFGSQFPDVKPISSRKG